MDDNTDKPGLLPEKRGIFRRTYWCLAVLGVLSLLAFGFIPSRLEKGMYAGDTPWPHLPLDTQWALHIQGAGILAKAVLHDDGMRAIIDEFIQEHAPQHRGDDVPTSLSGRFSAMKSRFLAPDQLISLYTYFGFLHRVAAPDSILLGSAFRHPGMIFAIARPPSWMRFILNRQKEKYATVQAIHAFGDEESYFAFRDDWLIASTAREAVQVVLDGWDEKAEPLGTGPDRKDAYAYLAARTVGGMAVGSVQPDLPERVETPAGHFAFGDPFAVGRAVASGPVDRDSEQASSLRVLVTHGEGEWLVWGDMGREDVLRGNGGLTGFVAKRGVMVPDMTLSTGEGVSVFSVMGVGVRERLLGCLEEVVSPENNFGRMEGSVGVLAGKWLLEDWLSGTGNEWVARIGEPVAKRGGLPYPLLPVVTLGWMLGDRAEDALVRASGRFGGGLKEIAVSVHRAGEGLAVRDAGKIFDVEWDGGMEGRVRIPEVVVNGGRPGWRFCSQKGVGTGWVSTELLGLPDGDGGEVEVLEGMRGPDEGHVSVAGGWNVGEGFVGGVLDLVEDRVGMFRNAGVLRKGYGEALWNAGGKGLGHFPRGAFSADVGVESSRLVFRVRVPHGKR